MYASVTFGRTTMQF